jgi:hypothetical protein
MNCRQALPFVVLASCGSSPDPGSATAAIFGVGAEPDLSVCSASSPVFATGSAAGAQILFQRPCRGFFGFGDTCAALTGVTGSSSSESWSVDKATTVNEAEVTLGLTPKMAGDANLTVAANGLSFGPFAMHAEDPATVTLGRYVFERALEPLDSLGIAEGGTIDLGATVQSQDGGVMCGQPLLKDNGSTGVDLEPDPLGNATLQANSTVRLHATAPSGSRAATVRVAVGPAQTEATLDVVPLSQIDSISANLTDVVGNSAALTGTLRMNVSAGSREVIGALVRVESLDPSITLAPRGNMAPAGSLETTQSYVVVVVSFFPDGGMPHGDIRLTVMGTNLAPTTVTVP